MSSVWASSMQFKWIFFVSAGTTTIYITHSTQPNAKYNNHQQQSTTTPTNTNYNNNSYNAHTIKPNPCLPSWWEWYPRNCTLASTSCSCCQASQVWSDQFPSWMDIYNYTTHTHRGHETQSTTTYTKRNCIARGCPASNLSLVGSILAIFLAGAPGRTSIAVKWMHNEHAIHPSTHHDITIFKVSWFKIKCLSPLLHYPLALPECRLLSVCLVPASCWTT